MHTSAEYDALGYEMWHECSKGNHEIGFGKVCRVIDDDSQCPPNRLIWTLHNGNTMSFGAGLTIQMSSNFVPCDKHEAILRQWQSDNENT